jgi:hypothetical protein
MVDPVAAEGGQFALIETPPSPLHGFGVAAAVELHAEYKWLEERVRVT